ncbi:acyl-CoA carboxylase subunit epsilon [Nocardia higoensis]|uniref:acyl-CoA carboxylase subunit epsilon n=1 Tax=Nocardia higoensis TaxID=228599 RepID=UPI0002E94969|nr:acyl-CoA carboxylase subunit epsilon [Nocardia higoensis]
MSTFFLRVEKGSADAEELGALTVLLYARHLAALAPPTPDRVVARRRPGRRPAFADPRAWTTTTR